MGVGADIEGEHAVARQRAAHRVDRGMRGERAAGGPQRGLEGAAMRGELLSCSSALRAGWARGKARATTNRDRRST